jgi:hypothetical protein
MLTKPLQCIWLLLPNLLAAQCIEAPRPSTQTAFERAYEGNFESISPWDVARELSSWIAENQTHLALHAASIIILGMLGLGYHRLAQKTDRLSAQLQLDHRFLSDLHQWMALWRPEAAERLIEILQGYSPCKSLLMKAIASRPEAKAIVVPQTLALALGYLNPLGLEVILTQLQARLRAITP